MSDRAMGDIPGQHVEKCRTIVVGTSDITRLDTIFRAPFNCQITAVSYIPDAAITGADTNTRHVNIVDRGLDGLGTDEIANKDYTNGVDATALNEEVLTMTSLNHVLSEGDVVAAEFEEIGTGIGVPAGMFVIFYRPDPDNG